MRSVSLPPWGLALVIAASAPFVVRLFGESLKKRKSARTLAFLARARREPGAPGEGVRAEGSARSLTEGYVAEARDSNVAEARRTSWHD